MVPRRRLVLLDAATGSRPLRGSFQQRPSHGVVVVGAARTLGVPSARIERRGVAEQEQQQERRRRRRQQKYQLGKPWGGGRV